MEKHFVIALAVMAVWYLLFMTPFILIVISTLIALLFVGILPGDGVEIPSNVMFLIYVTAGSLLLIYVREKGLYLGSPQLRKANRLASQAVKRRYNARLRRMRLNGPAKPSTRRRSRLAV